MRLGQAGLELKESEGSAGYGEENGLDTDGCQHEECGIEERCSGGGGDGSERKKKSRGAQVKEGYEEGGRQRREKDDSMDVLKPDKASGGSGMKGVEGNRLEEAGRSEGEKGVGLVTTTIGSEAGVIARTGDAEPTVMI